MKKFLLLPLAAAIALTVSCEKPASTADNSAQIEQQVQQRLAAERQADEQQRLAQQQADLAAREQALAARESASSEVVEPTATPRAVTRADDDSDTDARVASSDREKPRSYDTFYRKLEPYGAWRETNDYGYVWQPRQAQSRDWRPYTNGRWAYTDAGWTWVSDEPFGWATYHYGRWTRLKNVGWVWVPGEEWAPAWVSWRSSDKNVGWAPLPPEARFERNTGIKKWADSYYDISADEYVFIPNEDIGSERLESSIIPVERNVTIVNETTNVTNITYSNTTIVNEGPNFDQLRGRSRRPLERMRLQRDYDVQQDASSQAVVRGGAITMVTPLFTARAVERPRNVGEPIRQAQVERSWTNNANQPDAERARAKMKSEATPPPNAPAKRFEKPTVLAAAPGASPAATAIMATPQPAATASAAPIVATPTPRVVATATPIATATAAATATATPITTPTLSATAVPSMTPRPTRPPTAVPSATPTPVAPTPSATASLPVIVATPTPTPTPRSIATPAPTIPSAAAAAERERVGDEARKPRQQPNRPAAALPTPAVAPTVPAEAAAPPVSRSIPTRPVTTPRTAPANTATPGDAAQPLMEAGPVKRSLPRPAATVPARALATPPPTAAPAVPPATGTTTPPTPAGAATAAPVDSSDIAVPLKQGRGRGNRDGKMRRPGDKAEPEAEASASPAP